MPEQFRTRDCVILLRSDEYPVTVSEALASGGWPGGQGIRWVPSTRDEFLVSYSDGEPGGFILWGSNETSDQFTSMTRNQPFYRVSSMAVGSWLIMTLTYERYTYASRTAGPLVLLTYNASDRLRFSLRGFWTVEDEWTLSADPRAPNTNYTGLVVQAPTAVTENYLTIQTTL